MQSLKIQQNDKEFSKEQESFNRLLERIEYLKEAIAERKKINDAFNLEKNKTFIPILERIKVLKIRQIKTLDHLFNTRNFTKNEFRRLREEIIAQADLVLGQFTLGSEDEDMFFAILAFHKGLSIAEIKAQYRPVEIEPKAAQEQIFDEENSDEDEGNTFPKMIDKNAQSIRAIYIGLVKKLHPDKESDEVEKVKKTELIQQLTEAYENKDLLSLLTLQAKHEDGKAKDLKHLKSYNEILEKEVAELEMEYLEIYNVLGNEDHFSEKSLKKIIKSKKKELNRYLTQEEQLLEVVYSVPEHLMEYLK